ncbi:MULTISPECIES: LuxR C-terminal-related transcriptional regulator [Paenibacillus]|uniref:response regulator transcription factor n=1 Tax=Paenibacillus TaxID=44249 RepID=UPI000470E3D1|nr:MULTISPECIES: LuxR C-terminal-related transcriptional regulator [Paenibacillus]AJE52416.1 LuxR family transcriptional regulator [Paenibacillus polymyxa]AZH31175.1 LuxR family transcriptional regulator [Paenibacillus sp. M-152]MBU9708808.1 LuxR C-terminal-related transcriptional regulator [Paenibacillus sp. AK121]MEE4568690.1 LuxR C-terminal-related transcriptional regulator [Paenibacillus polymyxa]QOH63760.1 LuxR family transcriptional regulator [Paenibacillus polymyxa]
MRENQNLSPKEQKVAICIAQGYKDSEISRNLSISMRRTAEIVASIKEKWNIKTRVEIGIFAYHYGLVFLTEGMEVHSSEF